MIDNSLNPLVSVIIPVYNVEQFLERCIQSLICQSYKNIELIFVDDGSPDHCDRIIDYYKEKDERIIAIHKENQGVSAARNDGLRKASGKYIMFVDGDDYVEPDYVEYFLNLIRKSNCEMAISSAFFNANNISQNEDYTAIVDAEEIIKGIYLGSIGVAVWNKIYSKKVLEKSALHFNENFWFAEGMLFNIMYLQRISKVVIGNRKVYHVVENMESATRKFRLESWLCGLKSMEFQRDHWEKVTPDIQMAWEYHYRRYAESILSGLIQTDSLEEKNTIANKCIQALKSNLRIPLQVDISIWQKNAALCLAINPELVLSKTYEFGHCQTTKDRIDLFFIKLINKTPVGIKRIVLRPVENYYNKHYKPYYFTRGLL